MKYKLIKEYPLCYTKLGFIIDTDKSYSGCKATYDWIIQNPTKSKEFWQPIVEKDYEILSLICNQNFNGIRQGEIITKQENGRYKGINILIWEGEDSLVKMKHWSINSVKRLSDGEIFTIGDIVKCEDCRGKITSLEIYNNDIYLTGIDNEMPFGFTLCNALDCFEIPQKVKQPIFQTEDGVDIFEGDTVFQVKKDNYCLQHMSLGNNKTSSQFSATKINSHLNLIFSTKEKAEEYILLNKPCLSINEVLKLSTDTEYSYTFQKLKELVKSKI